MLQWVIANRDRLRPALVALLAVALAQCGGAPGDAPTGAAREAVIGGSQVNSTDSPVIYLQGREGSCTAVLLAPRLALTARHCVAASTPGAFSCTASGDLVITGGGQGQIGIDDPPASVTFFSAARANAGSVSGNPDAVGQQILSTQTPQACRDDLAFVVLDRAIPGLLSAPARIDQGTGVGETVSVSGFGLTDRVAPLALRTRDGVQIVGVGPDMPASSTQAAPVRALRIGPVTCQGDSGGPIRSAGTGAVIGIVSLGSQASATAPYCQNNQLADSVGPRLGAYPDLARQAFLAAGASPIPETPPADAGSADDAGDAGAAPDEGSAEDSGATPPETDAAADSGMENDSEARRESGERDDLSPGAETYQVTGGACATAPAGAKGSGSPGALALGFLWAAAVIGRRRR